MLDNSIVLISFDDVNSNYYDSSFRNGGVKYLQNPNIKCYETA